MKSKVYFVVIISLIFLSFVSAQTETPGLDSEKLQNDSVVKNVEKIQQLTEDDKWKAIGDQWKEALLNNKIVGPVDTFLKKGDWFFKILLARDYELSLTLFFAFFLWLITFIKLPKYLVFLKEKWMATVAGFAITVGIAQTQFFNSAADFMFRFIFFKVEWYWKTIAFLIVFLVYAVYYYILSLIEKSVKDSEKKKKEAKADLKLKETEKIVEAMKSTGFDQ